MDDNLLDALKAMGVSILAGVLSLLALAASVGVLVLIVYALQR